MAPLPPVAYRRAAARTSAAGTPVIASIASGELRVSRDEVAPLLERVDLAALAHEVFLDQALGDDDVREQLISATLVPGRSFR